MPPWGKAAVGEGSLVVLPTWWVGHLEPTWQTLEAGRRTERVAARLAAPADDDQDDAWPVNAAAWGTGVR
jgi:hypothetical protein